MASASAPQLRADPQEALGAQVFRGSWISLVAQATQLAFRLISTVVLARLLTPDAYGLVAMVTVVTGFISLFKSLGLATATVQAPRLSHAELNAMFWLNVAFGAVATIVTSAAAPLVSWFYADPRLTSLTIALSVTFLIGGFAVQHGALLRRQMRFRAVAAIEVSGVAIGMVAAILLARGGAGPWALVGSYAITEASILLLLWLVVDWRPTRPRFGIPVGEMVALGRDLTQFNVLNYWSRNLDNLLIGRFWGAVDLGLYSRAYQLLLFPLQQVTTPLSSVAIAALSRLNGDGPRFRRAYMRLLEKVAIACLPMTTFFLLNAGPVVDLVLGPRWHDVARVFTPLAVAGLVQPVSATLIWSLVSQGRRRELRQWSIIGPVLSCAAIIAGMPGGVIAVAMAYAACEVIVRAPLLIWMVGRTGPVRAGDVLNAILPGAIASAAVFVVCSALSRGMPIEGGARLGLALAAAVAAALGSLSVFPSGRRAVTDVMNAMRTPGKKPAGQDAVLLHTR